MAELTFKRFQRASVIRNRGTAAFEQCKNWRLSGWSNALAGEVGELCNLVKKFERDAPTNDSATAMAKELADVVAYAALIADQLGIDLGEAVVAKFNEVSKRVGSNLFIDLDVSANG